MTDLTKIDKPIGELDPEVAGALLYAYYVKGCEVEFLTKEGWKEKDPVLTLILSLRCIYRLKPEPPKHDYVNWEMFSDEICWFARDKDGCVYGYESKPSLEHPEMWESDKNCVRLDHFSDKLFEAGDLPWNESLIERPKGDTK